MKNSAHISRIAPRAAVMFAIILMVAMAGGAWAMLSAQSGTGGEEGGYVFNGVVGPCSAGQTAYGANGQLLTSCGVICLDSWGTKTINISDFPGCSNLGSNWTVLCINELTWTSKFIGNQTQSPDGKSTTFQAFQHGTCGIFPAGTPSGNPPVAH